MDVQDQVVSVYAGEDWNQPWQVDPDATTKDLTGAALTLTLKDQTGAVITPTPLTIGSGITVTDAPNGKFTSSILRADTGTWTPGARFDCDVYNTTSNKRIAGCTVLVKRSVRAFP